VTPTVQPSRAAWATIWSKVCTACGRRIFGIASIARPSSNSFIPNGIERSFKRRSKSATSYFQSRVISHLSTAVG
jgi:hypothetical protein